MRNDLRLGAAVLVLCGLASCGAPDEAPVAAPAPPSSSSAPSPTAGQVEWLNRFCRVVHVFVRPPEPPRDLHDEFVAMDFDTYLFNVGSALREVEREATASIAPEAFPRGRELVDTYTTAAKLLADKVDGYRHQDGAAEDVLRGYMTETTVALKMPKPPGLDLATLAATDGTVAQANERAENCRPAKAEPEPSTAPVALPQAKDGGNLSACSDGRCEVLVSAGAVVPVPKRYRFDVFRVRAIADGIMQIGAKGGNASMTSPMETGRSTVLNGLGVTAVAVGDGKAVLRLAPA